MGARGPAKTPTALNDARGNPGHRPRNTAEPTPAAGRPKMPGDLSPEARKVWRAYVPILLDMRVLTVADGIALAELCRMHALAGMIDAELAAQSARLAARKPAEVKPGEDPEPLHGALTQLKFSVDGAGTSHIQVKANPLFAMRMSVSQKIKLFSAEFGMTPASRARVTTVKPPASVSPFSALFGGKPSTPPGAPDGDPSRSGT